MGRYTKDQVREVLESLGIRIGSETPRVFLVYCPFHHNTSSPAMVVDKEIGGFNCFNEACREHGNLPMLVEKLTDRDYGNAMMYIGKYDKPQPKGKLLSDALDEMFEPQRTELPLFPQAVVDDMVEQFWLSEDAITYMRDVRGFTYDTMRRFEIGLSVKQGHLLTYPVHTPDGKYVTAVVGRGLYKRRFKNSSGMRRKELLLNLHEARKHSSGVIVVESGFDAMRIHQAGYPNVVATFGSYVTPRQVQLLERNFTDVIVFADNDDAGQKMVADMRDKLSMIVLTARWNYDRMYPEVGRVESPKDASDLEDTQIRQMIKNADNDLWI